MNFFTEMLLKKQLKGKVPDNEINKILTLVKENPDYFKKLFSSIQGKMKTGMSQEEAAMAVMKEDSENLKKLMVK